MTEAYRLSPQQARVWELRQAPRERGAYLAQCLARLEGALDAGALDAALRQVVERQEILRTTFGRTHGLSLPFQLIQDAGAPDFRRGELDGLPPAEREAALGQLCGEELRAPFDFERGPLLRALLVRLAAEEHALILTLPSLCADTWTLQNLVRELAQAYDASLGGERLTDEPLRYVQYSEWQNGLLEEDEEAEAGREFWRKQSQAAAPDARLPFEKIPEGDEPFVPTIFFSELGPEAVARVGETARKYRTTAEVVLLGCFHLLLHRLTSAPQTVASVSSDGRHFDELRGALGPLARSLPVAARHAARTSLASLVGPLGEAVGEARRRQDYFAGVAWAGGYGFEFVGGGLWRGNGEGLGWRVERAWAWGERARVRLAVAEGVGGEGGGVGGWPAWWQYDAGAVGEGAARRLAGQYARLVEAATADPARELGELELFGEEDERLLREWNETEADYPRLCVHELIEEQVKRTPDAVAVEFEGELLTYAELDARANQLARHLRGLGVGPDALVAVMLERSAGLIVSLLAVLKAGGAYVPLDPEYPAERLAFMLADSGARVLITQSKLASSLPEHGARVVALDAEREEIALHNADTLPGWAAADNLAYVIYTSGSTGRPKGVAIEHRQLVNYVSGVTERLGLASVKGFALISTFAADLGNTVLFPSLCGGGCLHLLSAETATDPDLLSDYFSRHAVDCLKIVPSHLAALQGSRPERILPRQKLILGGEASGWQWVETLRRAAPACEVFNHYGPTETTVGVLTYGAAEGSRGGAALLPLGRPLPNTRVYILDEKMRAVPVGVRGELYVGGAQVGRGYLGRPALTAERFVPDPFSGETGSRLYRTGDLARYLDDGVLEFLGRADDQIKVRGYRIEPGEIEAALLGHVAVRECVVLAREGAGGERRLVAYVVAEEGAALDAAELREYARGRLPQHMVPGWVVRLGRFPLTPNGKVDRRALPEPDGERPESGTPYEAPRDGVEQTLADIWGEALGVEKVGVRDSFFSLGGDSILSVRVVALAKERGLRFTIQELFRHQTIAELAAHVAAPAAGASAPEGGGAADEELARLLEEVGQLSDEEVFLRLNGGAQTSGAGETQ